MTGASPYRGAGLAGVEGLLHHINYLHTGQSPGWPMGLLELIKHFNTYQLLNDAFEFLDLLGIEFTFTWIEQTACLAESAVSDLIADIHPRTSVKVRAFAKVLGNHKALFAAKFKGRQIRRDRDDQEQHIVAWLDDENIHKSAKSLSVFARIIAMC